MRREDRLSRNTEPYYVLITIRFRYLYELFTDCFQKKMKPALSN